MSQDNASPHADCTERESAGTRSETGPTGIAGTSRSGSEPRAERFDVGNDHLARSEKSWGEAILDAEEPILQMIGDGGPLDEVLDSLCRMVETRRGGATCAIFRLDPDGRHLRRAAGPTLAEGGLGPVVLVPVGSGWGSSGAAVHLGEPVITEDIAIDPAWEFCRQEALDAGLRACWSVPISSSSGGVLGTFETFLSVPQDPTEQELRLCRRAARLAGIAIDRQKTQQALRIQEERLRMALDAARMDAWDWEIDSGTMTWLQGHVADQGEASGSISGSFDTFRESVHPEDRDRVSRSLSETLEAGLEHRVEYRHLSPGGNVRWVEGRGMILQGETGPAPRMLGISMDITARKRTEERLRQQREWFRVTLTSIGDAVIATDARGHIEFMNPAAESLTGWGAAEARARELDQVFHVVDESTRAVADDPIVRVLREGTVVSPTDRAVLVARDGAEHPIDLCGSPIRDRVGRVVGVVLVFRDVDERRRAEQALRESEQRLEQLADTMPQIVWTAGPDGSIDYFNARWYEYSGMSPDASLASEGWVNAVHVDDLAILKEVRNLAIGQGQIFETEVRVRNRAGIYRWHLVRSLPVTDEQGALVRRFGTATDIDDRKRAEESLRENEERFRLLTEAMPQLVWSGRPDGSIDYCNQRWLDFTGLTIEQVRGDGWAVALHPDDLDRTLAAWKKATETGQAYQVEQRFLGKDGLYRWFLSRALPLRAEDGTVLRWYGTSTDVTEEKRTREVLRESEARFRQLADAMPQIVWTAQPDGTLEYLNKRWFEYAGISPDPFQSTDSWMSYVHPEDRERVREAAAKAHSSDGVLEVEYRLRDRTGAYRWQLGRSMPVQDGSGNVVRRFGTATDIHDRKRAEYDARFLAEASAALASPLDESHALKQVAQLAVPFFADWCVVDMVAEEGDVRRLVIAHIDPAKIDVINELERRYPTAPASRHGAYQVIRSGLSEMITEITVAMLEAGARDAEHLKLLLEIGPRSYLCVPVTGQAGTIGAISFGAAESGRRFGPQELCLAEDLARRAAISIDNARLYSELKKADQRKDEFLATLAHELRNPLAPIRNALHLLDRPEHEGESRGEVRAIVRRQVDHMTRLVEDLLDVSRITRGNIELRKEVVDLATVINRSVEASRPSIEDQGHTLNVSLPRVPIQLEADPTRLEQVFDNLLNNAAKYTDPGGRISIDVERVGDHAEVRIRDTGIGISPEQLPKIFDLFMQAERRLDRSKGGLGIGLSLVRSLAELHGGSVSAKSEGLGRGTEFIVRVPVLTQVQQTPRERTAPKRERFGSGPMPRKRVLVVDDNVDAARTLAMLLNRAWGQDVEVVHDGPAAVVAAQTFQPDVILLDIGLPGLSGFDVARRLRERPEFATTVIVAMTGWGQDEDRRKSREAGFDLHLVKPIDPKELRSALAPLIK